MRLNKFVALQFITSAALLFAMACSTTTQTLVSQWSNPAYESMKFRRVIIAGSGVQSSIRRNFEDEFVRELRAQGVDAVPSYRYLPDSDAIDLPKLKKAAQEARADAAILARAVNVEQKTEFTPSYYPVPSWGFFGPHFGATWYGPYYGYPNVYHYDVYTSEVTFYDVNREEVVWTGTMRSTEADDVSTGIKSYVQTVMKALEQRGLVGKGDRLATADSRWLMAYG